MINPQMMGMGGQLPNVPSVQELWKDEKSKYRHWMVLFGLGMAVVLSLLIASLVMNLLDEVNIKAALRAYIIAHVGPADVSAALSGIDATFRTQYIVMPSVQISLITLGLSFFLFTLFQSYQQKSFAKLSPWSTMVMGIGAFLAIYQLFSLIWSGASGVFDTPGGIFKFVNYFITIAIWFGGASQVSRIRKQFAISQRIHEIKASPEYQSMMNQMNTMQNGQTPNGFANGPFGPAAGPMTGATTNNNIKPGDNKEVVNEVIEPVKSPERKSLEDMTFADLKKVAKKLSISGYSSMKKNEMIEAILRVTENN